LEWASHSRRAKGLCLLAGLLVLGGGLAAPAQAKVFLSRTEALDWAFPDAARVDAHTVVLTAAQTRAVEAFARAPVESKLVKLYTAVGPDGAVQGHALIDIHTVRTQPEAFLVVLSPEGAVRSLRVLAFYEPQEYLPPEGWLEQFEGGRVADDLELGGRIDAIGGSTLTSRAVSAGVRRSLALYRVLVAGETVPPPGERTGAEEEH